MGEQFDPRVYAAMQTGTPYATYGKTILGKVYVTVLSPFSGQPEGVLLIGNPKKNEDSSFIDVWTQVEDVFFNRTNKKLFDAGLIMKITRQEKKEQK